MTERTKILAEALKQDAIVAVQGGITYEEFKEAITMFNKRIDQIRRPWKIGERGRWTRIRY